MDRIDPVRDGSRVLDELEEAWRRGGLPGFVRAVQDPVRTRVFMACGFEAEVFQCGMAREASGAVELGVRRVLRVCRDRLAGRRC